MEVVGGRLVVHDELVAAGGETVRPVQADVEAGADAPVQRRAASGAAARFGRGGAVVVLASLSSPPQPASAKPQQDEQDQQCGA